MRRSEVNYILALVATELLAVQDLEALGTLTPPNASPPTIRNMSPLQNKAPVLPAYRRFRCLLGIHEAEMHEALLNVQIEQQPSITILIAEALEIRTLMNCFVSTLESTSPRQQHFVSVVGFRDLSCFHRNGKECYTLRVHNVAFNRTGKDWVTIVRFSIFLQQ